MNIVNTVHDTSTSCNPKNLRFRDLMYLSDQKWVACYFTTQSHTPYFHSSNNKFFLNKRKNGCSVHPNSIDVLHRSRNYTALLPQPFGLRWQRSSNNRRPGRWICMRQKQHHNKGRGRNVSLFYSFGKIFTIFAASDLCPKWTKPANSLLWRHVLPTCNSTFLWRITTQMLWKAILEMLLPMA